MNTFIKHLHSILLQISPRDPAFESLLIRRFLLPLSILLFFVFLSPPASAASCFPLPSDAAHWWRAEGSAQDSIGLNPGALEGGTAYAAGMAGPGCSFDGIDDLVAIPAGGFPTGASDRTPEAWG